MQPQVSLERDEEDFTHIRRRKGYVKMEPREMVALKTGGMCTQAKECWQLPEGRTGKQWILP